ncbi:MAG: T9SS type A sorting domain-containing protein [Salibacteraceae bacterium]
MKKTLITAAAFAFFAFQANAQFMRSYNPNDGLGTNYSMRGYDLTLNNGKYYYTAGDGNHKIIYEIDPNDGSVLTPSTNIATFDNTGSKTSIGKNSVVDYQFDFDPGQEEGPVAGVYDLMYLTGASGDSHMCGSTGNTVSSDKYRSHGVFGSGASGYSSFLHSDLDFKDFVPGGHPGGGPCQNSINEWMLKSDYADQTIHEDDRYMVGVVDKNYNSGEGMYLIKQNNNFQAPANTKWFKSTGSSSQRGLHMDNPTRTISHEDYGVMTSFGGQVYGSSGFISSATLRDPAIWNVDFGMTSSSVKTYHNAQADLNWNFGVAQSVIMVETHQSNMANNLIVSSGNAPSVTGENKQGAWGKNHFYLLRDWLANALNTDGDRITLGNPVGYNHPSRNVQVSDIVEINEDEYLIVGTFLREIPGAPERANGYEGLEYIFMIKIEHITPGFIASKFKVSYAKYFDRPVGNPINVSEIQANRVKIIDDDVYIIGSYLMDDIYNPNNGNRVPLLIKTDLDNQIPDECSSELLVDMDPVGVHEVAINDNVDKSLTNNAYELLGFATKRDAPDLSGCYPGGSRSDAHESTQYVGLNTNVLGENNISFFPNPAQSEISILGLTKSEATISIYDISGKIVNSFSIEFSETHQMDVSSLEKGVYILRVTQDGQTQTMKLVKE